MPTVTVLMSVYNGERYLAEAIDSILRQTYREFELLVIDDCSTDGSAAILAGLDDPRLRVLTNPTNIGLTRSLNRGLREASGELIARMDDDDVATPRRLELQTEFFRRHPETMVLGGAFTIVETDTGETTTMDVPTDPEELMATLLFRNVIGHPLAMFPRATVMELGGYNEAVRYSQDYELWLRLGQRGAIRALPDNLLLHRHDPAKSISRVKRTEQAECVVGFADEFLRAAGVWSAERSGPMSRFLRLRLLRDDGALQPGDIVTLHPFFDRVLATPTGRQLWGSHLASLAVRLTGSTPSEGRALHRTLRELAPDWYGLRSRARFLYHMLRR